MKIRRFLVAEDHHLMRQIVVQTIQENWPDAVCEEVDNGIRLLARVMEASFDLVISDISMPHMNGLEALKAVKALIPGLPVLVISIHGEERYAIKAIKSGAAGFIPKMLIRPTLGKAIRTALSGKIYISIALVAKLVPGG